MVVDADVSAVGDDDDDDDDTQTSATAVKGKAKVKAKSKTKKGSPNTNTKTKESATVAGRMKDGAPLQHTGRKDLDNMVKFVLDALNGVVYLDDGQISRIHAVKSYVEEGGRSRTEVALWRM